MTVIMRAAAACILALAVVCHGVCTNGLKAAYRFENALDIGLDTCGNYPAPPHGVGVPGVPIATSIVANNLDPNLLLPADSNKVMELRQTAYLDPTLPFTTNAVWTIMSWVRPDDFSINVEQSVFAWGAHVYNAHDNLRRIRFTVQGDSGAGEHTRARSSFSELNIFSSYGVPISSSWSPKSYSDSATTSFANWVHVAWQHCGSGYIRIILNGVFAQALATEVSADASPFHIGISPGGANQYAGFMDDTLLFDTCLTEEQIQDAMDGNLLAWGIAAGSSADPHFTGFLGQRYDVLGKTGQTYLWYSDEDLFINGELSINPDNNKTYMTKAALRFGGNDVTVEFSPLPNYNVAVHPFNENGTLDDCGRWADASTFVIQWHYYSIQLNTMTPISGSQKYHHIDLSMSSKARNPDTVHGLLGVSHRPSTPVEGGLEGEGVLEGVLADYEVKDGLLGTNTKFNRFKGAAGAMSSAECQQLLRSEKRVGRLAAASSDGL